MTATQLIKNYCGKEIELCNDEEIYTAIVRTIREIGRQKRQKDSKKKLYYMSAEFLIGRLLTNNLMNLGIYDEVKKLLSDNGKDIGQFEEMESEPSLGTGIPRLSHIRFSIGAVHSSNSSSEEGNSFRL